MRWLCPPTSTVATIALVVISLVGVLTILETAWRIGVGAYHQLRVWSHWPTDRKVFRFLKVHDHGRLHEVKEIAEALGKKPRTIEESLLRLAEKKKAQQVDDSFWGLHDFEE